MKKFLAIIMLSVIAGPVMAQHQHFRHGGFHRHYAPVYYYGNNWVAPLIIGGVVGAAIANRPVTQTETVIVQPQPIIARQENCSPWTETQQADGTIVRTRTCLN